MTVIIALAVVTFFVLAWCATFESRSEEPRFTPRTYDGPYSKKKEAPVDTRRSSDTGYVPYVPADTSHHHSYDSSSSFDGGGCDSGGSDGGGGGCD